MKLTYIILAHRLPAQLARLVNALADENVNFAIHIDRKADEVAFRKAVEANGIYWVNDRVDIYWGGFSQVQATFNSLEEAMSQFPQTDYFIYLSGQDFPIKSKLQLHLFFNHTDGKSFMEYFPLPHESWSGNGGLGRITNRYYKDIGNRFLQKITTRLAQLLPARKMPAGWKPFGGGCHFALTKVHARLLLDKMRSEKKLIDFYRHALCPDEMVVQTLLLNTISGNEIISNNLHLVHWQPAQKNPDIITNEHFRGLMASESLFARKFDETVDPKVIERVEKELLQ